MVYQLFSEMIEANGRTVRENNIEIAHKIPLGKLVYVRWSEWKGDGISLRIEGRFRVVEHLRDCDGTPLYGVARCSLETYQYWKSTYQDIVVRDATGFQHGLAEDGLAVVPETAETLRGDDSLEWPEDRPDWLYKPKAVRANRLVRWILSRLPQFEIRSGESTYLVRYTLLRLLGVRVYLHRFLRPDADACPHDHPWWFWSLVLSGGYVEKIGKRREHLQTNRPGRLLYRPAGFAHRIDRLIGDECWTLVVTGPKRREWGFHSRDKWISWRAFVDQSPVTRAAWCASS